MNGTISAIAPLLAQAFRWRRVLAGCCAGMLAVTLLAAIVVRPDYAATSSLLVLLGSEYTVRPNAGEAVAPTGMPDHEQILRTETEILTDPALERATIRRVGLARLYPGYLDPGWLHQAVHAVSGAMQDGLAWVGLMPERGPAPDPVDLAQPEFDRNLTATVLKQGDAIELSFAHKDPALAAAAVNGLVAEYLDRRRLLYQDGQLASVRAQAARLRDALAAAEDRLARFKVEHAIASFDTRRDILLHRQGDAERELTDAETAYAQGAARLAALRAQVAATQEYTRQSDDIETETRVSDLRTSLDGLHARLAQMSTMYRDDGLAVQSVRAQISARETQLAGALRSRVPTTLHDGENPVWQGVQGDALHAAADLEAATARRGLARRALDGVGDEIAALGALEQQFQLLQRQRDVAEDDDKSAARLVADREMIESVAAAKQASVRQIAPAVAPVKPKPTRLLILLGGVMVSGLATGGLLLGSNLLRGVYLLPAELEADLGVAVLACVPELPAEAARDLVLSPAAPTRSG